MRLCALMLCFSLTLLAGVRVVPLERIPESNTIQMRIMYPEDGELEHKQPVKVQLRIRGFPLGVISQFPRKDDFRGDPKGQTIHLFIDNDPYVALDENYEYTYIENRTFYERILTYEIPAKLKRGEHVVRALPARSFGESSKDPDALDANIFYLSDKKRKWKLNYDPSAPNLTYNEPQGTFDGRQGILVDFYLSNCELSKTGYKVLLYLDGDLLETITEYTPYAMYGLSKGLHKVTLELVDKRGDFVEGPFNKTTRDIVVK
ncbi:MAG: hypothetical protein SP1CHLAM54_05930 [Chlamydiia bacterium]|nr:hypothetical protein [Chlamydiia bacterium]MCH9615503.1 hypothetical protein [Chlamydiia bacterium]MCH9629158.1 hypothetical protein [Chlamydiia bacterium]